MTKAIIRVGNSIPSISQLVIQIHVTIRGSRHQLSQNTIRLHKMLLRCLICQVLSPVLFFILPLTLSISAAYARPTFIPADIS